MSCEDEKTTSSVYNVVVAISLVFQLILTVYNGGV